MYFLVIQSVSNLIMTFAEMVSSMSTFILMQIMILVTSLPLWQYLFQTQTMIASDNFYLFRYFFGNIVGNYTLIDENAEYFRLWQIFTIISVLISNVYMLNFLVAILNSIIDKRGAEGDFAYKQSKY
jgi:hypothetical protein